MFGANKLKFHKLIHRFKYIDNNTAHEAFHMKYNIADPLLNNPCNNLSEFFEVTRQVARFGFFTNTADFVKRIVLLTAITRHFCALKIQCKFL